jgi:hAT family C-terminal dimerisation region
MESIVDDDLNSGSAEDDYQKWVKRDRLKWDNSLQPFDLCTWWRDNSGQYPTLSRLARDLLAIPAMSAKNERNFSSAGYLISSRRTELNMRTVEATECLRHWHLGKGVNLDTRNEHDEIEDEKQDEWEDLHDPE